MTRKLSLSSLQNDVKSFLSKLTTQKSTTKDKKSTIKDKKSTTKGKKSTTKGKKGKKQTGG